jgi:PAS domain S-box-containing protein
VVRLQQLKQEDLRRRPLLDATLVAVVAVTYILGGKLGLKLAFVNEYTTAVWPPTGIALAGLLLWGYRMWPGVLIGAFLVNVTTGDLSVNRTLGSVVIASGNTLEALLGAYLVNRFARGARAFERAQHVFAFAVLAAIVSTTISATVGVTGLLLSSLAKLTNAADIWFTWWIGDASGDLVFAPALILWASHRRPQWTRARMIEVGLLTLCLSLLFLSVFTDVFPSGPAHLGRAIVCVPPLLWVAFRLGQREAATAILVLSCIAVWGATHGLRIGQYSLAETVLEVQAYLAITSLMVLAVAAEVSEGRRREREQEHLAESLREHMQIVDLACVLVRDTNDRITQWSSGAESLYGFTAREAVGEISHELFQTQFSDSKEQIRARLLSEGRWRGELRHKTREGREIVVASLQVLHHGNGAKPAAILEVNNDITEQRRIENSLREQAQLLDLTQDAILSLQPDGTIEFWNRGAEERYGWRREEAIGQIAYDLLKTEFPDPLSEIKLKLAQDGYWQGELVQSKRDGSKITVASRWAVRRGKDDQPSGYLEITTDITERKRTEQQLRQTQRLEGLGILAGGIAHDFNNLLVGVLGNASLALDMMGPATPARQMLQGIISASERAASLTRQLLAYAGKEYLAPQPIDLSIVVRDLTGLLRTSIPKTVYLALDLQDSLPYVNADQTQLQQVIMNLVINAAEAIPLDTPGTVKIMTATRRPDADDHEHAVTPLPPDDKTYVVLTVADTGQGMTPEIQSRIFDPFYTTKFTGRGLGLSAVLGIVKAHQGAITLKTVPGKGTTFTLLLPSAAGVAPVIQLQDVSEPLHGSGTVLVVDDEPAVRAVAQGMLEHYGYRVLLAEDGRQGIETLTEHPEIIAIILDLAMPVMTGDQAAPQMRSVHPTVPIILTSGYPEAEARGRVAAAGITTFLQKPYTAGKLLEKLAAGLGLPKATGR